MGRGVRGEEDQPTLQQINAEIFEMVRFYGTVISTPNMTPEIYNLCNANVKRLLERMESDLSNLICLKIAAAGNIKLL